MKRFAAMWLGAMVAVAGLQAGTALAREKVDLKQTPAPVQDTIRSHAGKGGTVKKITLDKKDGHPVYSVEYEQKDGKKFEMTVDRNGKIVEKSREIL